MTDARRTPLYDLHVELGGRMVDFAGWLLPIQYDGVIAEHERCRTTAALFDVSHMGIVAINGDDPARSLERVTPSAIVTLGQGAARYSLLTNDSGGIIDDCIITNSPVLGRASGMTVVVNAARREVDLGHLRDQLPDCDVTECTDLALLAVQGPAAVAAIERLVPQSKHRVRAGDRDRDGGLDEDATAPLTRLSFMEATTAVIDGIAVSVTRSGYTGEDGVEITVANSDADRLARLLLADEAVGPAGLGARDTLRLEAGLCLYGSDLDKTTSPIEAGLRWTIPVRRRQAADFPGAARVLAELADGTSRVRVGLGVDGRRPVRAGATLHSDDQRTVGVVTSGGFGPTVGHPVAMGYVEPTLATIGTQLLADVRGKLEPVTVANLPFVPHNYAR